ncbi:MAG: oligosaccharide flippase family protein [Coriobacteriia bacterium]|nr:oligosaccharide flippase family protein [Coriobacteriia bacterium]
MSKVDKNDKIFIKNTGMLYLMTVATYLFPLILLPYLTRVLQPDAYGLVMFMTATITYFQIFVDFGFNFSSTKIISQCSSNYSLISKTVFATIFAKLILVLISFIIFICMIPFVQILRNNILLCYLYFASMAITIFLTDFLYRGIEMMEIITFRYVLAKLISTILTFMLVQSPDDIILIPCLNIIGTFVAVVFTWLHMYKVLHIRFVPIKISDVLFQIKKSSIYFVATFATTLFGATNTFILGLLNFSVEQIACWSLAFQIITAAQAVFNPIINSLYPHMTSKIDLKLVKKLILISVPVIIIGIIVGIVFSPFVVNVFAGPGYEEAILVLQLLLPLLLFSFIGQLIGFPVLGAMDEEKKVTFTIIIASSFHVVGIFILWKFNFIGITSLAILRTSTEFLLCMQRVVLLKKALQTKQD